MAMVYLRLWPCIVGVGQTKHGMRSIFGDELGLFLWSHVSRFMCRIYIQLHTSFVSNHLLFRRKRLHCRHPDVLP